jgi:hypothetical protein
MIASCWDWPSLKYAYYILDSYPLDAGGWSPTRGIVKGSEAGSSDEESIAFDDCLPELPIRGCYFAGSGDFCIGELYVKKDAEPREEVDMDAIRSQNNPDMQKVAELLDGSSVSAVSSLRGTDMGNVRANAAPVVTSAARSNPRRTLWSYLVPSFAAVGTGWAMYSLFNQEKSTDLNVKTLLFSWVSGLAVGVAIGQEYASQPFDGEDNE